MKPHRVEIVPGVCVERTHARGYLSRWWQATFYTLTGVNLGWVLYTGDRKPSPEKLRREASRLLAEVSP